MAKNGKEEEGKTYVIKWDDENKRAFEDEISEKEHKEQEAVKSWKEIKMIPLESMVKRKMKKKLSEKK